jgi:hypothetical protein
VWAWGEQSGQEKFTARRFGKELPRVPKVIADSYGRKREAIFMTRLSLCTTYATGVLYAGKKCHDEELCIMYGQRTGIPSYECHDEEL